MVGRLFKGSLIIGRKNAEFGEVYSSIAKKYGKVEKEAQYYHRGKGNWAKYSPSRDAKFKSKNICNISARFTVKPRKFNGKTFHLACPFCVFPTKKKAKENLEWRKRIYTRMLHRIVELPKSQQLINFDDRSKPLKYAVFEAYKDPRDEPKGRGLAELFD